MSGVLFKSMPILLSSPRNGYQHLHFACHKSIGLRKGNSFRFTEPVKSLIWGPQSLIRLPDASTPVPLFPCGRIRVRRTHLPPFPTISKPLSFTLIVPFSFHYDPVLNLAPELRRKWDGVESRPIGRSWVLVLSLEITFFFRMSTCFPRSPPLAIVPNSHTCSIIDFKHSKMHTSPLKLYSRVRDLGEQFAWEGLKSNLDAFCCRAGLLRVRGTAANCHRQSP